MLGLLTVVASPVAERGLSGAQLSVVAGGVFSSCGSQAPEHRLRSCSAWAQLHVGSSRTRGGSHVSCTGTRIPHSSATRETQGCYFSFSPHCRPVHKSLAWSQLGSFLTCPEGSRLQVPCMHMEEEPSLPVWSGTASTGSDLS